MARYIDKDKAIKAIVEHPSKMAVFTGKAIKAIESLPTADVVEVVRCKDLKEYARQMRENCVKDRNGNIICSDELWEQIASIIENIGTSKEMG